ncbi:MAG: TolC family protein, partial [Methylococcaceae bacterium]|nr:TolC family protein [Methylococcaceae bacterium]
MTHRFPPSWCLVLSLGLLTFSPLGPAKEAAAVTKKSALHTISLNEAIDLAFAQNPDLAAAPARIGQAESRVAEVAAGFYPQLQARVGYDYTNNPALAFSYIDAQRRFNANMADFNNQIN